MHCIAMSVEHVIMVVIIFLWSSRENFYIFIDLIWKKYKEIQVILDKCLGLETFLEPI